jgi:hypothetical protein
MKGAVCDRKIFRESSKIVSNTIDNILDKGAENLYDKYIYSKIPSNLTSKLSDFISVIFNPITNASHERGAKKDERPHQSTITRINLANTGDKTNSGGNNTTDCSNKEQLHKSRIGYSATPKEDDQTGKKSRRRDTSVELKSKESTTLEGKPSR